MEEKLIEIYEIFKRNLLGASIISEVDKDNTPIFTKNLKEDVDKLEINVGINKLNKNQSLVLIISSFDCFFREFFKTIIDNDLSTRRRFVKRMKNKEFKEIGIEKISHICEKNLSLGEVVCEKFSFTSTKELDQLCDYIGIEFEYILGDIIHSIEEENKSIAENLFKKFSLNHTSLNHVIFMRNKFIHEGKVFDLDIDLLNSLVLSLQLMAAKLITTFLKKPISFGYFLKYIG